MAQYYRVQNGVSGDLFLYGEQQVESLAAGQSLTLDEVEQSAAWAPSGDGAFVAELRKAGTAAARARLSYFG